jgi:hypothetical protein
MYCRHAKEKRKERNEKELIRTHAIIHWDDIRKHHSVFTKE